MKQINLKRQKKPRNNNIKKDIEWICNSLNLSSGRDTECTSNKIIIEIINKASNKKKVSTESLSKNLDLSQNLINHHLRNIIKSGLIHREKKLIYLRGGSLKETIKEIRYDALRMFENIEEIAEEVDKKLGINNR